MGHPCTGRCLLLDGRRVHLGCCGATQPKDGLEDRLIAVEIYLHAINR